MSALNRAQAELAECDNWDIPSSRPSTLIVSDLRALVRVVECVRAEKKREDEREAYRAEYSRGRVPIPPREYMREVERLDAVVVAASKLTYAALVAATGDA